jgi:hypothetical protein
MDVEEVNLPAPEDRLPFAWSTVAVSSTWRAHAYNRTCGRELSEGGDRTTSWTAMVAQRTDALMMLEVGAGGLEPSVA